MVDGNNNLPPMYPLATSPHPSQVKIAEAEEARLEFHRAELRNIEKWLADQDEAEKATIAAMETTCDEKQVVIPLDESMAAQPGYQPGAFERLLAPGAPGSLWSPIQIADARGHLYSIYEWDKIKEVKKQTFYL
mgnify:FL=1